MTRYITTKDILIPAGTELQAPPTRSSRWGENHEAVIGHGRDHASYWSIGLSEALALGLVEEA